MVLTYNYQHDVLSTDTIRATLPWKIGAYFQQVRGPELVNWPIDSSRKKIGIPTNTNMITYGMKNAPENSNSQLSD